MEEIRGNPSPLPPEPPVSPMAGVRAIPKKRVDHVYIPIDMDVLDLSPLKALMDLFR